METASNTVWFTTTVNIPKFLKSKRTFLKKELAKLKYNLHKTKWYQIFYRYYLNVKIESLETKISVINSRLKELRRNHVL